MSPGGASMISIVWAAHRSQMYTLPNILVGPATSFATSESLRPQKEQPILLPSMLHLRLKSEFPLVSSASARRAASSAVWRRSLRCSTRCGTSCMLRPHWLRPDRTGLESHSRSSAIGTAAVRMYRVRLKTPLVPRAARGRVLDIQLSYGRVVRVASALPFVRRDDDEAGRCPG